MTVQIAEIIRLAEQGRSGPYVCRGEDGFVYYVKGRNSGRRSQIVEWLCAQLAERFGLPLPPFELVEIVPELLAETPRSMQEIGAGLAFGSREHPRSLWFEPEHIQKTDGRTKRDILVFDWWVHNTDRLTNNPNLLWDATREAVITIDHNMAFDPDFVFHEFINYHIFGHQVAQILEDWIAKSQYLERLQSALSVLDVACESIPDEWWWVDDERTVATAFDLDATRVVLQRCNSDDFWRMA